MVYGGTDLDAAGNAISTEGLTIGANQDIGEKVTVGLAYGLRMIDAGVGTLGSDTEELKTILLNLQYRPVENISVGVEYTRGERSQFNNTAFSADRIQTSVQFNF